VYQLAKVASDTGAVMSVLQQNQAKPQGGAAPAPKAINFRRSAFEHEEPITVQTVTMTTATQPLPLVNIPAYGFLRGVWIKVALTGGTGGTAFQYDGYASILQTITLQDTSGNPLYGPIVQGALGSPGLSQFIQKYGGYGAYFDPQVMGQDLTGSIPNITYWYYIPIEILKRNGLGSITNLNAAAAYQLSMTVNSSGNLFTSTPSPQPTVTVSTYFDAWSQPPAHDVLGNQTTQRPPALNTTQFWTVSTFPVNAGFQKVQLTRLGYYLRNLIFIFVSAAGIRADSVTPLQLEVWKDNQPVIQQDISLWRQKTYRDFGYAGNAGTTLNTSSVPASGVQDTGVYPLPFCNDFGLLVGDELRNGYLPTLQSTKLEVRGTFQAGGTLVVLTNDVAPPDSNESIFIPVTL
jgi:hypothetical protein